MLLFKVQSLKIKENRDVVSLSVAQSEEVNELLGSMPRIPSVKYVV